MKITDVVFDIGNVLVDWQPHLAWLDDLGSAQEVDAFLKRTKFADLNLRADGGEKFADLAQELSDPDDQRLIASYVEKYPLTVRDAIEGTWDIMDRLRAKGLGIHAITNWSAETWPQGLKAQPRLGTSFDCLIVSGVEKMLKPSREIYALFCARSGLAPQQCLFIDDREENVDGAKAFGMQALRFSDPDTLENDLLNKGIL